MDQLGTGHRRVFHFRIASGSRWDCSGSSFLYSKGKLTIELPGASQARPPPATSAPLQPRNLNRLSAAPRIVHKPNNKRGKLGKVTTRPQKIMFGEMRASGVRGVIV